MKIFRNLFMFAIVFLFMFSAVSCGAKKDDKIPEVVELTSAKISDVEFKNSELLEIKQNKNEVIISGVIDSMSSAQKQVFGEESVSYVVVLKFKFDKEKTLSKFEIKGKDIKVFSDDDSVENYSGKLSEFLDSKDNEDAFANLILSASVREYKLTATYTDGESSVIELKITAALATATGK